MSHIRERLPRWLAFGLDVYSQENPVTHELVTLCRLAVLDGDDPTTVAIDTAIVTDAFLDFSTVADCLKTNPSEQHQ